MEIYERLRDLPPKESNEIISRFIGEHYPSDVSFSVCGACNARFVGQLYFDPTIECEICYLVLCCSCASKLEKLGIITLIRHRMKISGFECKRHNFHTTLFDKIYNKLALENL